MLSPVNGGESSGAALFGRYKKNVLLQVTAEGLDPSPSGQTYTIWLSHSPKIALQIGSVPVGAPGKIAAQFQIPPQLLAYVANGAFDQVDVALTDTATYQAAMAKAKGERNAAGLHRRKRAPRRHHRTGDQAAVATAAACRGS